MIRQNVEFIDSVSVFDIPSDQQEKIYHAFILDRYEVKSNRESSYGRYDVSLIPKNPQDLGVIMEFKKVGRFEKSTLEKATQSAFKQIADKNYAQELEIRLVKRILFLVFAFKDKKVAIKSKLKEH